MAAGSFTLYDVAKKNIASGTVNFATGTLVAILASASYTPNLATDATYANVSAYEVTGTGYTTGGVVLTGESVPYALGSATILSGGTGYVSGDVGKTVTVGGGTSSTAATATITSVSGGLVTGVTITPGVYSVPGGATATTSGGGTTGSGLTLTTNWGVAPSANNPTWSNATITAKYLVVLTRAGGSLASTDAVVGYVDLNTTSGSATVSSTNGTFTVQLGGGATSGPLLVLS